MFIFLFLLLFFSSFYKNNYINNNNNKGPQVLSAAKIGNDVLLNELLNSGAPVDICDENNWTPLFWCIYIYS